MKKHKGEEKEVVGCELSGNIQGKDGIEDERPAGGLNAVTEGYRYINAFKDSQSRPRNFNHSDLRSLASCREKFKVYDLYFAPASRIDRDNRGTDHLLSLSCLLLDIDFNDIPEAEARGLLAEFPLSLSAIVHTS